MRHNPLIDPRELERLHDQSFSWALTCVHGRRSEAEDVLQMTYLAILEGRARFGGASSLRTWLFAVIRNHARSRWRRAAQSLRAIARLASLASSDESIADGDTLAAYQRVQASGRIVAAWRSLPARQREVLDLVFYRDLSLSEAAEVLGVALGTARMHYERGKAALRHQLAAGDSAP